MTDLTVLVVDDDPAILELLTSALDNYVEEIATADSAERGLELFEQQSYDAVLLDVELPGMTGLELLTKITDKSPTTHVVIMTGNASIDVAIEALRGGAYDFMVKPFESIMVPRSVIKRIGDKLNMESQIGAAQEEIRGLYQYFLCAQELASALTFESVQRAAVEGLNRLIGGGRTVFLGAEEANQPLRALAVAPHDDEPRNVPITRFDIALKLQDRLEAAAALREAFKKGTGRLPRASYVLLVANQPHGVLVLEQYEHDRFPVSEDVMALFITQVERSLANAVLYERMRDLSVKDPLTGLYNHRYFQDRLTEEVARAQRHGHNLSLLFTDIDDFKNLNDSFGHPVGDQVLVGVANILRGDSRSSDIVIRARTSDIAARYGGEEFVMILPETPLDGALIKAERVRAAIQATDFPGGPEQPLGAVTVSVGVATFPHHASDKRTLIEAADRCLYRAKEQGKNRVVSPK